MTTKHILIDAREFIPWGKTGIGRFLEGLIDALADSVSDIEIILACFYKDSVPLRLKNRERVKVKEIPREFLYSEKILSNLTRQEVSLFISPYPKLPLFSLRCPAVHTVHDVLDLRYPVYRRRIKVFFDILRLKKALKRADLTWYVSSWSRKETIKLVRFAGKNPRVRFSGIDECFTPGKIMNEKNNIKKYQLEPGYILVIGNGLAHKNLGVLLKASAKIPRSLVFVGVSQENQNYWKISYPHAKAKWIRYVNDENLLSVIRGAFCLAQPSMIEGYGFPPLEAMACGVPAVVSHIPVLVETTGENALKANPEDSREWVKAFEVLENKDIYKNQIEKGLKWIQPLRGRRGWQKHISDIEELLRKN